MNADLLPHECQEEARRYGELLRGTHNINLTPDKEAGPSRVRVEPGESNSK